MSTTACTQPGCTGAILDGYCDVCGSPGPVVGGHGSGAGSRPSARARRATVHPAGLLRHDRRRVLRRLRVAGGAGRAVGERRLPHGPGRRRPDPVDRVARLQPARLDGPRLGAGGAGGSKVTRRVGTSSTRLRGARLGAGLTSIPPVPAVDAAQGDPEEPDGPGGPADLPVVRVAGRALPRRPARAHRGLLPEVPQPVLLHAQAARRATSSAASTRSPAPSPTAASAGSTSRATATSPTAGSCSRAC